jgi:ligand-binding sensor domain-containing protein
MTFARLLLACLLAMPLLSQHLRVSGRSPFMVMGPDQGLPTPSVICLTQDVDGFLWMGTENGLLRYEGGRCRRWTTEDGLPSAFVSTLIPAQGGGVWAVTPRGLVRVREGGIQAAQFPAPGAATPNWVARDGKGGLWALMNGRLFQQVGELAFRGGPASSVDAPTVMAVGLQSGAVYLGGRGILQAFLPDGGIRTWGIRDGLSPEPPALVAEDGGGQLWVGTGRKLVMKAPGRNRFLDQSTLLPASLSPNCTPLLDRDGSLWLPLQNGVLRVGGGDTEWMNMDQGLPFRWVRSLFRDREGTLWVWGPTLARMLGGGRIRTYSLSHGPVGEIVWFILRDPGGQLLVGTDDGAARMGPGGLQRIPGTEGRRIKGLAVDGEGTLWMVGTTGPTLWLRKGQSRAELAPLGEAGAFMHFVTVDSRGQVWLGHATRGVLRWDPSSRRLVQEAGPSLANAAQLQAFGFREDARGNLWVGTSGGLLIRDSQARWHRFTQADGLRPFHVLGTAILPDGSAWVHYLEPHGLTRVRFENGRLEVLEQRTRATGLRSNRVYALEVDARGRTWASTDQGLDRLDPPLHLGLHDGMPSEDCNLHALLVEGGRVWVGTLNGLVSFDTTGTEGPAPPPEARITSCDYGPRNLHPPFGRLAPLASKDGTVAFRVATPAYLDEWGNRFQARLLGLEGEWRDIEGNTVRYPVLRGGSYRFEVRAARADGPFGPASGLDFTVRPPWWMSGWVLLLEGLAGAGGVLGIIRLRVASLARSKTELERLVANRTVELRTRNAELSEALAKVKVLSGLLPICANCKKIRDDRGYWNQLEEYICEHSEVDFSHGICPDCIGQLYPEMGRQRKEKRASDPTPPPS